MPGNNDHRLSTRSNRLLCSNTHQRLAANFSEHLVDRAHARGAAGCEHHSSYAAPALGHTLFARLRPRHDLHQQTANAHAGNVSTRDRKACEQSHQHPIETVFLGAACASRRAKDSLTTCRADQHQVSRINRHAEMFDLTADSFDRRGYHIAAVRDG